jgi:anti-sigma B factor antagonist
METRFEKMNRCGLLRVSGRIDSSTAPAFEEELLELLKEGNRNLVVNLRDVTFISSAGLRALVSGRIKARRLIPRGDVVLAESTPFLREVFELVGFEQLFTFYDTDTEAVGSF